MPDFKEIYSSRAIDYDRLVSREDADGNLARLLAGLFPKGECDVVELGAGTGRLTRQLAPRARRLRAFDASPAMLEVAREHLEAECQGGNWRLDVGLNECLPCEPDSADLVVAGWTIGHQTGWYPLDWRDRVRRILAEMDRVCRPGGTKLIIETLGTGRPDPSPPTEALAAYYAMLEDDLGFERRVVRTDYVFASVDEAEELTRFFFGAQLADRVRRDSLVRLPECTGAWIGAARC